MSTSSATSDILSFVDFSGTMLGEGSFDAEMSRGSFKAKKSGEKLVKLKPSYGSRSDDAIILSDGSAELRINIHADGRTGTVKLSFDADRKYNRLRLVLNSRANEKFYGCGEQFTHFNLKGQRVKVWVSEHQNAVKIAKKCIREKLFGVNPDRQAPYSDHQTYIAAPSFMSSDRYFVDCDCDSYSEIHFAKDKTVLDFWQIPKSITLAKSESFDDLCDMIRNIIGTQKTLPNWVGDGAIIASQGGEEALRNRLRKLLSAGAKISAVWCQDWSGRIKTKFGTQVYWNWQPNEEMYPKSLIDELHEKGIRFLGYINPYTKQDSPLYKEAVANGFAIKRQDGSIYHVKSTTFDAAMVDFTNPSAYEWYKSVIKDNMLGFGLDGFMADFGEYLPTDAVLSLGDAKILHNAWATVWQKLCSEAVNECGRSDDIFIFNRAAYRSTIPYSASLWNGDQHVDWSDEYGIGSVIPATLSLACIGGGVCHSDIGGYTTIMHMRRSAELFTRWAELAAFSPVFRCHEGNRPDENVQCDDERVISDFARLSRLFSALKPYRDRCLSEYCEKGLAVMRPLFWGHDEDWCYECKDEFMFGSDILVSAVLRSGVTKKTVRLPRGKWVRLMTDESYSGGEHEVNAPLGMPVAFYKKESEFSELFKELASGFERI